VSLQLSVQCPFKLLTADSAGLIAMRDRQNDVHSSVVLGFQRHKNTVNKVMSFICTVRFLEGSYNC